MADEPTCGIARGYQFAEWPRTRSQERARGRKRVAEGEPEGPPRMGVVVARGHTGAIVYAIKKIKAATS